MCGCGATMRPTEVADFAAFNAQVPPPSLPLPVVAEANDLDECALLATPTGIALGVAPGTADLAPSVAAEGVLAHSSSSPRSSPSIFHGECSPCKRVIHLPRGCTM